MDFANGFLMLYDDDNDGVFVYYELSFLTTDEIYFTLTCSINAKLCLYWEDMNSQAVVPVPLYETKVIVPCGIAGKIDLHPYFFVKATSTEFVTCFITSSRCTTMLQKYVTLDILQKML